MRRAVHLDLESRCVRVYDVRTRLVPAEIDHVSETDGLLGRAHLEARATVREESEEPFILERSLEMEL